MKILFVFGGKDSPFFYTVQVLAIKMLNKMEKVVRNSVFVCYFAGFSVLLHKIALRLRIREGHF